MMECDPGSLSGMNYFSVAARGRSSKILTSLAIFIRRSRHLLGFSARHCAFHDRIMGRERLRTVIFGRHKGRAVSVAIFIPQASHSRRVLTARTDRRSAQPSSARLGECVRMIALNPCSSWDT